MIPKRSQMVHSPISRQEHEPLSADAPTPAHEFQSVIGGLSSAMLLAILQGNSASSQNQPCIIPRQGQLALLWLRRSFLSGIRLLQIPDGLICCIRNEYPTQPSTSLFVVHWLSIGHCASICGIITSPTVCPFGSTAVSHKFLLKSSRSRLRQLRALP